MDQNIKQSAMYVKRVMVIQSPTFPRPIGTTILARPATLWPGAPKIWSVGLAEYRRKHVSLLPTLYRKPGKR